MSAVDALGWLVLAGMAGLVVLALLWARWSRQLEDHWSIGIYAGIDPLHLAPHPALGDRSALTAEDITDVTAGFVADPFIVRDGPRWHMFFEVLEAGSRRGVIGLAASDNGWSWRYQRIVLREPFHLSYPYVFAAEGSYYMIPESGYAACIRLYRAAEFPHRWELVAQLLGGTYWDASIIQWQGLWWLFALDDQASLCLFHAPQLRGPWSSHPRSPIVRHNRNVSRPGGRLILYEGKILRYAQDGEPTYGSSLRAFRVDELSTTEYREHELTGSPVLAGTGRGWNATGMHHADAHELREGDWIACVDGNRQRRVFNGRAGVRRIASLAGLMVKRR